MEFQVDPTTRVPIYRQLMDQIRLAVARGRLKPGSRLPSVRVLSRELVVNPNTIARVYTELEREGVLNTRPGLGRFRGRAAGGSFGGGPAAAAGRDHRRFSDRRGAFGVFGG